MQKIHPVLTSDSTEEFQEQLRLSELVLDALFPVYHTLDILSRAGNPDATERAWLADSLCILLNWDVQNSLRKCVAQTADSEWLSHWLKHLYGNIKARFETVTYTACPAKLPEQAVLGDVAGDVNGVFFAIQVSDPEYLKDYLDHINFLLKSMPDLDDSPGSAASPAGTDELKDKLSDLTRKAAALSALAGACKLSLEYIPQEPDGERSLKELSEKVFAPLKDFSTNSFMSSSHLVEMLAELNYYLRAYQKKLEDLLHTYTEEQKVETSPETAPASPPASPEAAAANGDGDPRPDGAGQETNPAGGYAAFAGLPDKPEAPDNT